MKHIESSEADGGVNYVAGQLLFTSQTIAENSLNFTVCLATIGFESL